jgi:hypothetical protein
LLLLLLLGTLRLLPVLILWLLLSALGLLGLVFLRRSLSLLLSLLVWLALLLGTLLFGLGLLGLALLGFALLMLALLLFGTVLLFVVLLLLRVRRTTDSEKQRQNGCAGDSNNFHGYYPPLLLIYVRLLYRKLPVVALTGLPMASPDTRSSTLRFCCRPAELAFEATGKVLPKPRAETEFIPTP